MHSWPGNVRELENVIERAASLTTNDVIDLEDLPEQLRSPAGAEDKVSSSFTREREEHLRRFERTYLENLLRESKGNVKEAARRAGLPRTTIYRYLEKYGLVPREFR